MPVPQWRIMATSLGFADASYCLLLRRLAAERFASEAMDFAIHVLRAGSGATAIGYIVAYAWCIRLARPPGFG
jgi:hypothetical protein